MEPTNPRRTRSKHVCSQTDNINKINKLLVGNHTPENGVVYKMIGVINDVQSMKSDIEWIKDKITKALELSAESRGKEEGSEAAKREGNVKSRDTWYKVLTIVSISIAIASVILSNLM